MIEDILPTPVVAVETRTDIDDLFPEEAELVARAVDKRKREFATARWCAHKALADLGHAPAPILRGPKNEPLWPTGVVGALTHCDGYRAAAVAPATTITGLGIDAEPHEQLPAGTLKLIARPEEIPMLSALASQYPATHWDKVLFSAKESVYKVWYPLAHRWLDFQDATLHFDPQTRTFEAELHQPGLVVGGVQVTRLNGRFAVEDGLVVTAVVIEG